MDVKMDRFPYFLTFAGFFLSSLFWWNVCVLHNFQKIFFGFPFRWAVSSTPSISKFKLHGNEQWKMKKIKKLKSKLKRSARIIEFCSFFFLFFFSWFKAIAFHLQSRNINHTNHQPFWLFQIPYFPFAFFFCFLCVSVHNIFCTSWTRIVIIKHMMSTEH